MNTRNFALDIVRGLAICLVLFNHIISNVFYNSRMPPFTWYFAYMGVDMFFALSGFLIGGILIRLCSRQGFIYRNATVFFIDKYVMAKECIFS